MDWRRVLSIRPHSAAGGVTPPAAEWGLMLNTLRQSIYVNAVVPALPGLAIFVTSMAFNLLSDGLRDAMEIRA